jgi:hypothetical protein
MIRMLHRYALADDVPSTDPLACIIADCAVFVQYKKVCAVAVTPKLFITIA